MSVLVVLVLASEMALKESGLTAVLGLSELEMSVLEVSVCETSELTSASVLEVSECVSEVLEWVFEVSIVMVLVSESTLLLLLMSAITCELSGSLIKGRTCSTHRRHRCQPSSKRTL